MLKLVSGRMICCSRHIAHQFGCSPGVVRSVLRTVVNCVPTEQLRLQVEAARLTRTDLRPRIIMVATLEAHKDHDTLLRAMPRIVQAVPGVQLLLAGEGILRSTLEQLSETLKLEASVRFLGSRKDIPELLGQCDAFVLSTTPQEGLPTVLLEAMAAGIPIVASDVAPCREALDDGRWGLMVPPSDPQALAETLITALTARLNPGRDPALIAYLERFRPARMIEGYFDAAS